MKSHLTLLLTLINLITPSHPLSFHSLPPLNNPSLSWITSPDSLSVHDSLTKTTTSLSYPSLPSLLSSPPTSRSLIQACLPPSLPSHNVLDLTFGFGSDSLILLSSSTPQKPVTVHGTERDPRVFALASEALARSPGLSSVLTLSLVDVLSCPTVDFVLGSEYTVVYIDVMFTSGKKNRAKAKGHMELLRTLHGTKVQTEEWKVNAEREAKELLMFGLRIARDRVVCKRPKGAPPVGGMKPSFVVGKKGANIRYDVYVT
ncbi:hypothetical protein TrCOL_g2732 [Triparma columacea]|uniref:S-adenosyl-L-methionine-dependent methyltransferase n=1 Tax=Triparma columacea TaxID=722753 RepID=A0A9W7L8W7_9STRA|nr:hypothetical protein TrCOL_g2732 [Triparma columacea]